MSSGSCTVKLRCAPVELQTVVNRALETVQPLIEATGHQLIVALPEQPVWLEADLVRLAQVVSNLLNNAVKYTHTPGQIKLSARCERGQAVLRVRDTGIGIAAEMLPRIFEMYMQTAPADSHALGGLGIGLTLVRNLVELHHGTVEARSAGLGCGTEFVVRLPVSAALRDRIDESGKGGISPPTNVAARRRVLIVDDNQDAADSLRMLLRLLGHQVRVAHHGGGALEAVAAELPEIVLLDIGMPGMDGYEVARRLRALPEGKQLVLVALTGWGQEHDRQRSRAAGFDQHLTKPVESAALEAVLQMQTSEVVVPRAKSRSEPVLAGESDPNAVH
ncbi:MAG: response regulator [Planctomycetaceae bacterium]|nr:response regulator [Planctomycetaceae bacterium]